MRFHRQPQLALVLGCSARHVVISEARVNAVSEIIAALKSEDDDGCRTVFAYATTNPRLCSAFGIAGDSIPTAALRAGKKVFRLAQGAPFDAASVLRLVNFLHCEPRVN